MKIEELLNKYFEGETTCEEEHQLRNFFTQDIVPEHLESYRPMFAFFEEEKKQGITGSGKGAGQKFKMHRFIYYTSGIAAGVLLLLGIASIHKHLNSLPENYVIIDGKCYTDENLVREQAMAAFQNVSTSEDELLDTLFGD